MSGPSIEQLVALQSRLSELSDEGAVGLLSKMDVALLSWALGYSSGGVEQGIPSPRAKKPDPHWLVKDFHVLYRTAKAAVESCQRGGFITNELVSLQVQLYRLLPAFEQTESERVAFADKVPEEGET